MERGDMKKIKLGMRIELIMSLIFCIVMGLCDSGGAAPPRVSQFLETVNNLPEYGFLNTN